MQGRRSRRCVASGGNDGDESASERGPGSETDDSGAAVDARPPSNGTDPASRYDDQVDPAHAETPHELARRERSLDISEPDDADGSIDN